MEYIIAYMVASILHGVALYFGLRTIYIGQDLFVNSCPMRFFSSEIEQKFWTVCIGSISNMFFLMALPLYIVTYHGEATGELEPVFLIAHVTGAFSTVIWHSLACRRIKEIRSMNDKAILH